MQLNFSKKNNKNNFVCISTCYRVGTLAEANHKEIDNHLHKIALNKKISRHILVGDFNLSNASWPEGLSTNATEKLFLDTFSDLGLQQMVNSPTHQQGRILDLVLTNKPSQIVNLVVLDQNSVCHSDHYGITFSFNIKIKSIVMKRKVLNYKKSRLEKS